MSITGGNNHVGVLFVCLGNICRSPMAEIVMKQKVKQYLKDDMIGDDDDDDDGNGGNDGNDGNGGNGSVKIEVDSCGTAGYHIGEEPDERTIQICKKYYGNIKIDHLGRKFEPKKDLSKFDYILVMDKSNYRNVLSMIGCPNGHHKVKLLGSYDPKKSSVGDEVDDPYYGGVDGFDQIFHQISRCCDALIEEIKQRVVIHNP